MKIFEGERMDELFKASLHTHELVVFLLIVSQLYFLKLKKREPFVQFVKSFKKLFMVQNVLLGIVVFTGLLMLTVMKFAVWNFEIIAMIFLAIAILVHQIIINRRLRPIRSDEPELQEEFKQYASKVYLAEAVVALVLFVFAKVV
jgi:uncharacterized ion transporter superfamily protein YfcC